MVAIKDNNRCGACGANFGTLVLFDEHREEWRIDYKQRLVGRCLTPQEMGLVDYKGAWYTREGAQLVASRVEALHRERNV